nr:MAG TPA: Type I restriction enzyme Methylase [Caudoviricetes sp.]
MAKRFIDLYNEAQQKKQAGAQKVSLPAAPTQKKTQTTRKASLSQLSMPGSIGQTYRDELPKLEMPKLKTAQTTAPQIKKSYAPKADNLPNIRALGAGDYTGSAKLMEKAAQTIRSGVLGAASGFAEVVGQATPTTGDQHMGQFSGFGDLGRAVRANRETGADISESVRRMEQERSEKRKAHQQKIYDTATELAERSAELREQAKQGAGKVGGFLVDLGVTVTQVAGDALANALLPGSGMAMMATRVYGQSAGDTRREGKTEGQQIAAGLKGAAIETLTEKLFGGLAKAYGAGTADEVVEKIADKLTRSDAGKRAATWLINSGGEGVEEVLSDILNPLADRALGLDDGEGRILTADDAAQMGYDFLLGAAMGALGGAGQLRATKSTPAAQETQPVQMPTMERAPNIGAVEIPVLATEPAVRSAQEAKGVNFDTEPRNTAERLTEPNTAAGKIAMPRMTDAAGNTYAQRQAAATFNDGTKSDAEGVLSLLRSNIPTLEGVEPVANVTGQEVGKTGRVTDRVYNFFQSIGGKVRREGFGDVLFSKSKVKNSMVGHGIGDAKIELAAAVPGVIENGVQINYTPNWKGRGYDSYVFAAPVTYKGAETYVTAVIIRDTANRYYLHEALDAEGNMLYGKAEDSNVASDTPAAEPRNHVANIEPSVGSIAQTEDAVNEVEMPVISESAPSAFVREGNIIQRDTSAATPADAMTWQEVYNYESRSDAPAEMTQEPISAADRAEVDAYMDALAQDENVFADDPYTPADAVYDAQLRRLQKSEAPPAAEREQILQADLDELASLYADQADVIGRREYLQDATSDMVTTKTAPKKQSRKEAAREAWDFFYRKMVDAGHSVTKLSEAVSDPYLYQFYNQARASSSAGVNMITDAQTDVKGKKVGDSLNDVFSPIRARGDDLYHDFQLYMFDLHNIDRMSLSEGRAEKVLEATAALRDFDAENPGMRTDTAAQLRRLTEDPNPDIAALARERARLLRNLDKAEAIQDKPVFDYEFSAEDSRARAERLLTQHPEFAEYRAKVRKYIDNMMQYRVDSGLMTQEDADFLKEFYPNYVPTMRVQDKDAAGRGRDLNAVRIGKTVGRAQGGTERLVPLHEALGKQTMKVAREGSKNRFADRLLRDYLRTGDTDAVNRYVKEAIQYEHEFNPETLDDAAIERPSKDKIVTAYMDGKLWEMTVDDTLFDAMKALSPDTAESNKLTRVAHGANNLFKSLVTGYNPTFLARNVIRDLQTAGLNTRDAAAFARNYPRALAEIKNNGDYWQLYKALGGVYSSVFDYNTGIVKEPKGRMGKVMARVEALNMAAEQAPRLAEFMGVMQEAEAAKQRGEAVSDLAAEADALYAAADITVNFGRSGSLGKVLNANYVPFLNPGVQGLDKLVRRVTETKGAKEWAKLAARAAALGIAPSLLNALLYHDDDEWDDLRDSDKDTNYMFKLGNGYWLKIPKGRELSLLGITADRVADAVKGEDVDILSTINTMGNQVAPANPLTSNIFSALIDSQLLDPDNPGRTWYGGDIESQRLQNYAPGERYDSSTDVFSKAVGKALGISPKKLNYVLDQYSGVLGDFLLPVLTPQAERGMFEKAFTVDAMSSNRVSGDFYDEADKLKYAKNSGDVASGVVSRWWNKQQTACSDLWKRIREVESSAELSNSEKKRQTRELKAIVTGIQKNAIAQEGMFREAVESHLEAGEDEDTAYREANKDCFGAEYALQAYNKDVYERAQDAKRNGVSYDDFYTYYFGTKGIKAIGTESAVSQKFDYLRRSGISEDAQAEIYFADMASDKTLLTQAELEMSAGITPTQYYSYKAATSSMSKKAEKMEAIAAMDLTSEQKDALYYSEGWAESKIYEAPWRSGGYVGVQMPVLGSGGVTMPVLGGRGNTGAQMPVLGGDTMKMPVLEERSTQRIKMPVLG